MDQVSKNESRGPAHALDRLNEDSSILDAFMDKSICYAEVLLSILSNFILDRYV